MNRRNFMSATASLALATFPIPLTAKDTADFPFALKRKSILGHEMAFVDEGAGHPVVFLHGNPTSSYLWRNIIPAVTANHRAIAPDLIGMGASEKPELNYDYSDQASHLHGLLDALELKNVTLVLHDWGGALGFDWAIKNPDRVKAIAFMETIAPPTMPFENYEAMGPFGELFKAWRTPGVGEKMILQDNMFINEILGKMAVKTPLSDEVLAHYNSYYPNAASRAPLLAWPRQVPIGGEPAETTELTYKISEFLTSSQIPKLLFHVSPGALVPPASVQWLEANALNLQTIYLGEGQHFIQEDYPSEIGAGLSQWLATL